MISVDTKKKAPIGNYVNTGQQWRVAKAPLKISGHDFPGPDVPRAYPCGIYDIGRTATAAGLKVTCRLDRRKYATGHRISNDELTRSRLVPAPFHGEWNCTIHPTRE